MNIQSSNFDNLFLRIYIYDYTIIYITNNLLFNYSYITHNIIQIHNNVMWHRQYPSEYSHSQHDTCGIFWKMSYCPTKHYYGSE